MPKRPEIIHVPNPLCLLYDGKPNLPDSNNPIYDSESLFADYTLDELKQFSWLPQPGPQEKAWGSTEIFEIMYGGARGGGKSDLLLGTFKSQAAQYGVGAQGVIFRGTYKQLEQLKKRGNEMFVNTGLAEFKKGDMLWDFYEGPTKGAVLKLRYLESVADTEQYQGHEYSYIGYDEATNFKDFEIFEKLKACARSSFPGVKPIIRYTCNPGGPLHLQIKSKFVDPAPLGNKVLKEVIERPNKSPLIRTSMFIPSKLSDNKVLQENDPMYEATLRSIRDPELRKAWLDGSWDVALGGFFTDVWSKNRHIVPKIKSSQIPNTWRKYRAFDWGSTKPYAGLWFFVANETAKFGERIFPRGAIVVYDEQYGCVPGKFDVGLRLGSNEVAKKLLKQEKRFGGSKVLPGPADHQMWARHDGKSTYEKFRDAGVNFEQADKDRLQGWEELRVRLIGEDEPLLYITENCEHLIRTLPALVRDDTKLDDINTHQEDHLADTLRYIVMSKKIPPKTKEQILEAQIQDKYKPLDKEFGY